VLWYPSITCNDFYLALLFPHLSPISLGFPSLGRRCTFPRSKKGLESLRRLVAEPYCLGTQLRYR
jgi:hypothetical protein